MKPKALIWEQPNKKNIWIGKVKGITVIQFNLEHIEEDKYLLTSNIAEMRKLVLRGLENAKYMTQEFFNSYTENLME